MNLIQRGHQLLSPDNYAVADQNIASIPLHVQDVPKDQYVLRMMVRCPWSNGLQLPPELEWVRPVIRITDYVQSGLQSYHPFLYVTVRSGIVRSVRDDEWHVDGFSMRIPHVPEQNYIWSDCHPTEVLNQQFVVPDDFDPMVHNLHQFIQDRATAEPKQLNPHRLYQIDPYIVHRRPQVPPGTQRSFFRISYVPIEIEDDACQQNPLLPPKSYNRSVDVRESLIRYEFPSGAVDKS